MLKKWSVAMDSNFGDGKRDGAAYRMLFSLNGYKGLPTMPSMTNVVLCVAYHRSTTLHSTF